ncbi:hypothetical protein H0H92_011413, partial [Tricholoma furcatifolium]
MSCGCQHANNASNGPVWAPNDGTKPTPSQPNRASDLYRPDILQHIEETLRDIDGELRELSLDIHCVGVAIAIKRALEKFNIAGTVELLGTPGTYANSPCDATPSQSIDPAEEIGDGKLQLLDMGAYKDMAACLMCHPAPGPVGSVSLSSSLALAQVTVEYSGHTAHAALSPWEGRNALDAAVLAYNNISALRQQLLPTHRVHGIFEGKDWAPNIIPDYAKMRFYIRAPTRSGLEETVKRVLPCFEAAALATGCTVSINRKVGTLFDLRQNSVLGGEVAKITTAKYGAVDYEWGIKSASTDFGNVTYALPSLHPGFAIPSVDGGGNHTIGFTQCAATPEAHGACMDVTKALAATGVRVLIDDVFLAEVKKVYDQDSEI